MSKIIFALYFAYQKWQICYCSFFLKNALMKWNLRLLTCLVGKAVTLCFKGFINVGYSMKVLAVKFIYEKCKTLVASVFCTNVSQI